MKPAKKNIEAAQALVKRYTTITLSQIKKVWKEEKNDRILQVGGDTVAQTLTGFGSMETCTLCKSVNAVCKKCIYQTELGCGGCGDDEFNQHIPKEVAKTYLAIRYAKGPVSLQKAFRNRAKVIKSILKTFEKG